MLLEANPDTADLREKVSRAWQEFARALADVLAELPADAYLDLTLDPTASGTGDASYTVSVTVADDGSLAARAVGNGSLPESFRLNRAAIADLVALGWSPPGVEPGSGDQFGITTPIAEAPRLATVLCRTMRDIYGAPHPAFLVYWSHDAAQQPLSIAPLGSARAALFPGAPPTNPATAPIPDGPELHDAMLLREQVHEVVAAMQRTTPDQLIADGDGDIGIRAGTAMVFVKVRDNPPLVDVFSPILTEIKPSEQLYGRLSELTNRMPVGRLYCANETVWASVPVFGRNFQPSHLVLAVQVMTGLADELDDRLQGEFGGRRFFAEDDHPTRDSEHFSTGMYL
ncbi:hypothetical protein JQS43_00370 [Natronosporangium hydrolyticum]|uniref:YbjN domain-containing protein n=1 Tax=Natronosporangium hydrolyticum TaxID=2811111 RepID=A0A895YAV9_9ACTN|nr:YbjN domain-containing protein [Natronosporangium hydrolyticum]QSB14887.1 hypothetical protein JQS43_00370 [Natronosporangium hydrolyticum]